MKFKIHAANARGQTAYFYYDNMTSILTDSRGARLPRVGATEGTWEPAEINTPQAPLNKLMPKILKIQLGLSCNYSCDYCNQRYVPEGDNGNPEQAEKFLKNLDIWLKEPPETIEFWGGEPLVYIKTMKPLAEGLREKYPEAQFGIITNGSLLNPELNEWLDRMGFAVGLSHDGPGQIVRGPDPLKDPAQRANIKDLFNRLLPKGRISFNSMMNRENFDRAEVEQYFKEFFGEDEFSIGEGSFIDAYDEGGLSMSLHGRDEHLASRRKTLEQTRGGKNARFWTVRRRLSEWKSSIKSARPASALGQKCGMDRRDNLAVDLRGNVLTCQNVNTKAIAPNGRGHVIGHVSRLDKVKLVTSTHWSARKGCVDCPVLQLCKGSCMFLENELWDATCDNAYTDHIPFFAVAIEEMTGFLPFYIEAEGLPEDRKNIWGGPNDAVTIPQRRVQEQPLANK